MSSEEPLGIAHRDKEAVFIDGAGSNLQPRVVLTDLLPKSINLMAIHNLIA